MGRPPSAADCVEGVAASERADAPGGVGAEVPRAVRDDDDVGCQDLFGGEHPRPHRDRLELPAEGLSGGDPSVDQSGIAELEHESRERSGQRGAVRHDVDDASFARTLGPGGDRSDHRVQRRADDRCVLEAGRALQRVTMTLFDARDGRLHRRVPHLHDASGDLIATDVGPLDRDDEVHATRAEAEGDRGRVEDHHVADGHRPAELRVGDRRRSFPVDIDLQLVRTRARGTERDHDTASHADHPGTGSVHKAPL